VTDTDPPPATPTRTERIEGRLQQLAVQHPRLARLLGWFVRLPLRYAAVRGHRFITVTVAVVLLTAALNPVLLAIVGQQLFRPMSGAVFGLMLQLIFVPFRDDVSKPPDLEAYYDRRALLMGAGLVGFCLIP
jgi:hypothetical protein